MHIPEEPEIKENSVVLAETTSSEGPVRGVEHWADIGWLSIAGRQPDESDQPNVAVLVTRAEVIQDFKYRHDGQILVVEGRGDGSNIARQTLIDGGSDPVIAFDHMKWHSRVKEDGNFTAAVRLGEGIQKLRLVMLSPADDTKEPPILDPRHISVYTVQDLDLVGRTVDLRLSDNWQESSVWD